jgi:hypothetical protein
MAMIDITVTVISYQLLLASKRVEFCKRMGVFRTGAAFEPRQARQREKKRGGVLLEHFPFVA